MNGPYDNANEVKADLRHAITQAGEDMESTGAHERLFLSTTLRADIEMGAYDLMAVRAVAAMPSGPALLQAFRSMLVRAYNSGAVKGGVEGYRIQNVPGTAFH